MNKNKGFIGIGLILAIILGIVVIGGGAYYLGKSSDTKKEVKTEENNLPNNSEVNQNQNLPVDNQQVKCDSNSIPSIIVLSPNGGEVYTVGDKIMVKWESCNIPQNVSIFVNIYDGGKNQFQLDENIDKGTVNDGSEEFLLGSGIKAGSYILRMTANKSIVGQVADDKSNNVFTINSGKVKSTIYSSKTFGYSIGYSDIDTSKVYVTGDGKNINLFPNQSNIDTLEVVDSSYVIPNDISSVGTVKFGVNQFNKFKDSTTSRHTYYLISGLQNNKSIWISIENDSDIPNYLDLSSLKIN